MNADAAHFRSRPTDLPQCGYHAGESKVGLLKAGT